MMDREQRRWLVLEYLYKRDEELGPDSAAFRVEEAAAETSLAIEQVHLALRELGETDLIYGPRGAGIRPENGYAWITADGRAAVERHRRESELPPTFHVELAGFTPDGRQQFFELYSQVSASERAQFQQLLKAILDESRPEEDRLEKAATLVELVKNSKDLLVPLIGALAPQAGPLLTQLLSS